MNTDTKSIDKKTRELDKDIQETMDRLRVWESVKHKLSKLERNLRLRIRLCNDLKLQIKYAVDSEKNK